MKKQYFLRTVNKNCISYNNFKWDLKIGAINTCGDWNEKPECGGGLHGIRNAVGSASLLDWSENAIPFVFSSTKYIDIDNQKSKVQKAKIEFVGKSIPECSTWIYQKTSIQGGIAVCISGGYGATVSGGDRAMVSGGDEATVSGGYGATVSGGYEAIIQIKYYDGNRYRIKIGYIGEDGLKPNIKYKLNDKFEFEEVKE